MSRQLSLTVSDKADQYLEWLCAEGRRSAGSHVTKAAVVRALLQLSMRVDIDLSDVDSQPALEQRIWDAITRRGTASDDNR